METTTINTEITYNNIFSLVNEDKVKSITTKDKKIIRLFVSGSGNLCYFPPRMKRRGLVVNTEFLETIEKLNFIQDENSDLKTFKIILKYHKKALKNNSFTNSFIESCKKLPGTFDQWVKEDKKSLYEYGITTGNKIDGKIITLKSIKTFSFNAIGNEVLKAINQKKEYRTSNFTYNSMDANISVYLNTVNKVQCSLNLYGKKDGKEYSYLLINEAEFIGYDVD